MLVVMQSDATAEQVSRVLDSIKSIDLTPHTLPGPTRTAIAITGNTGAVDARVLEEHQKPGTYPCRRKSQGIIQIYMGNFEKQKMSSIPNRRRFRSLAYCNTFASEYGSCFINKGYKAGKHRTH